MPKRYTKKQRDALEAQAKQILENRYLTVLVAHGYAEQCKIALMPMADVQELYERIRVLKQRLAGYEKV